MLLKRISGSSLLLYAAIFFSLLLSVWIPYHHHLINPDAICYLSAAKVIAHSGLQAGMQVCGQAEWPFYSWLIQLGVKLFPLSFAGSAYLIDSFFSLLSVLMFLGIIKALGGTSRILWIALAVMLLAHEFNAVRAYIVRDHAFYAFYLMSIWCYLRYLQSKNFIFAIAFSASLMLATLFRIEGIVFLGLLPCLQWLDTSLSWKERFKHYFNLNLLFFAVIGAAGMWMIFHSQQHAKTGRLAEIPFQLQHGISLILMQLAQMKKGLAEHVLNVDSATDAGMIMFLLLPVWYMAKVIGNLSLIYAVFILYAWRKKITHWRSSERLVLWGYVGINVLITFFFLLQRNFLTKRYLVALSLTLMIWLPFGLHAFWMKEQAKHRRYGIALVVILLLLTAWTGIFASRDSKNIIKDAGVWVANTLPSQASIYINDSQLAYYAKPNEMNVMKSFPEHASTRPLMQSQWKQYQYLVLRVLKKDEAIWQPIIAEINQNPIKVFTNRKNDRVLIYQIESR